MDCLIAFFLCLAFIVLDCADDLFESDVAFFYKLIGSVYDFVRKAQFLRNLKSIGLARYADGKSVGRTKRLDIEFYRSIFNALRRKRIFL